MTVTHQSNIGQVRYTDSRNSHKKSSRTDVMFDSQRDQAQLESADNYSITQKKRIFYPKYPPSIFPVYLTCPDCKFHNYVTQN